MNKRILIGVIMTECQVDFQKEILRGIISQAFKSSCDIAVLAPLHNFFMDTPHKQTEKKIYDLILSDRFDGFLYGRNTFYSEEIKTHIDNLLLRSGKPVMLMDSADHRSFETTSIDDCAAFEQITDHLIEVHGFSKIYCLTGPRKVFVSEERLKGYKNSMKKHGLYYDRTYCYYGDFWREAAKDLARRMIRGEIERPEAIICGNDFMAISLAEEFASAGIRVPEDIALTGYDASEEGYSFSPSITSFARPNFQMGAEALRRLYRIITGRICNRVHNENGELRTGRSCGCPDDQRVVQRLHRQNRINARFESNMLMSDMLFDITNVDNTVSFADRLDNYTYFIYKLRHITICLTKKYIESPAGNFTDKLDFNIGDDIKTVLEKSAVKREPVSDSYFSSLDILPVFDTERNYSVAYYISPLHYNDNFFGYSAISFGKEPISFSTLYLQWINYVNVALEQLRMTLSALDESFRAGVAVLFEQALFQTAAVDTDTDGDAALPAGLGHLADIVRLADVAGVDADLVHAGLRRREREPIVKMNVGHDRDGRGVYDLGQGVRRGLIRHGEADDLAPGVMQPGDLLDGRARVRSVRVAHRLHRDRRAAADGDGADMDLFCLGSVHKHSCISERPKTHESPRRKIPPRLR